MPSGGSGCRARPTTSTTVSPAPPACAGAPPCCSSTSSPPSSRSAGAAVSNAGSPPPVSAASNRSPIGTGTGRPALDRPALERVLALDFLDRAENVLLVGAQGLGKTMLAKNIVHQVVLAGHSARFITASDLLLDLNGQETARALERRLRHYARPALLAIDEIGYLAYDAHAADLLFQIVSRRYEYRPVLMTTNLAFKHWDTIFPNASCAVALIDRLTHHAEIVVIEGDRYRKREAELSQKQRRTNTRKRR